MSSSIICEIKLNLRWVINKFLSNITTSKVRLKIIKSFIFALKEYLSSKTPNIKNKIEPMYKENNSLLLKSNFSSKFFNSKKILNI
jgi:hypothetical protein